MFFVGQFSSHLPVILVIILYLLSMSGIMRGSVPESETKEETVCDNYNSYKTTVVSYEVNKKQQVEYTDIVSSRNSVHVFHLQYLSEISNYYYFVDDLIKKFGMFFRPPPVGYFLIK